MPSQKRYRQHQESNNSARFRDLPPRFKRQKSSTTVEDEPESPESIYFETQKKVADNQPADTKKRDSQESVKSPASMAPSYSNVYPHEENLSPRAGTSSTPVLQTPQVGAAAWQYPQKSNGSLILSPWNSRQFDRVTNTQQHHVPLGTHFGYKSVSPPLPPWTSTDTSHSSGQRGATNSPPLPPWTSTDTSHSSGQRGATNSPTWMSSSMDPCTGQQGRNSYFNNENWAPTEKVKYHSSPPAIWCSSSPPPQQCIPSPRSQVSLSTSSIERSTNIKETRPNNKQMIDYSDPDIRTIEMLRELERVADEKESESDSFGADRKSLVSHHLRMLMCAVDRYTEGIDDEISMATRGDEVAAADSYLSTPNRSPVPSETWTQKQVKETTQEATPDHGTSLWSPSLKEPIWKGPAPETSVLISLTVPTHNNESLFSSPQVSPVWKQPMIMKNQDNPSWDLWSSPSFFSGVLINKSAEEITQKPSYRVASEKEHFMGW